MSTSVTQRLLGESKAPNSTPKTLNNKKLSKRPLLRVSAGEKAELSFFSMLGGYALVAGIPEGLNTASEAVGYFAPQAADWTAKIGLGTTASSIASISGLGVLGSAAGGVSSYYEIQERKEKAMRLEKEISVMFNLAADCWDELEQARKEDEKAGGQRTAKISKLEDDYYQATQAILRATSSHTSNQYISSLNETRSRSKSTARVLTLDEQRMDAIIQEYYKHREQKVGEQKADTRIKTQWTLLKAGSALDKNSRLMDYFLDFNSTDQVDEYFKGKKNKDAERLGTAVSDIQNILKDVLKAQARKTKDAKEEQVDEFKGQKTLGGQIASFRQFLRQLNNIAAIYQQKKDKKAKHGVAREELLVAAQNAYVELYSQLVQLSPTNARKLKTLWETELKVVFNQIMFNMNHYVDKNADIIIGYTAQVFGENGDFGKFLRGLPDIQRPSPDDPDECMDLNFEAHIHRGGSGPAKMNIAMTGIAIALPIYGTAKGLYVAAIALGATALASSVVGLIVVGLVISLTLLSIACYYRSERMKSDRETLATHLREGRVEMITTYNANKKMKEEACAANQGMFADSKPTPIDQALSPTHHDQLILRQRSSLATLVRGGSTT